MMTDDPLISEHEWGLLAEALRASARPWENKPGVHLMLRIAYCGECDSPMYHQHNNGRDYYRCHANRAGHGLPGIRAEVLEQMTEDYLLRMYGDDEIMRRISMGKDYTAEIAVTERELRELDEQYIAHNLSAERFATVSTRIEARLAELRLLATKAVEVQWEPTGETVRQRWERSSGEERHTTLRRLGVRFMLSREYRIAGHAWRWYIETNWLPVQESHERLRQLIA